MKIAASIFSWLGGLFWTVFGFVSLARGYDVTYTDYVTVYGYSYPRSYQVTQNYPTWVWILAVLFIFVRLIILIWRQTSADDGNKVGCGVCTLLFVSIIGGILTLCIPNETVSKPVSSPTYIHDLKDTPSENNVDSLKDDKERALEVQKNLLFKGVITRAEYDRKASEINASKQETSKEKSYIEEIKGLKELLDMGAITLEEYDEKKSEILNRK